MKVVPYINSLLEIWPRLVTLSVYLLFRTFYSEGLGWNEEAVGQSKSYPKRPQKNTNLINIDILQKVN